MEEITAVPHSGSLIVVNRASRNLRFLHRVWCNSVIHAKRINYSLGRLAPAARTNSSSRDYLHDPSSENVPLGIIDSRKSEQVTIFWYCESVFNGSSDIE